MLGTISDGDVRRFLINDGQLSDPVELAMESEFKYFIEGEYSLSDFKLIKSLGINSVPVISVSSIYSIEIPLEEPSPKYALI